MVFSSDMDYPLIFVLLVLMNHIIMSRGVLVRE
jgi:hypothetical protein